MENKLFELLEKAGFEGCDDSISESLRYGFVYQDRPEEKEIYYIAVYEYDEDGEPYILDHGTISYNDIEEKIKEEWFNGQSFLSFIGISEQDYEGIHPPVKLHDMIRYCGIENILGSCYYAFYFTPEQRNEKLSEYGTNYGCGWIGDIDVLKQK